MKTRVRLLIEYISTLNFRIWRSFASVVEGQLNFNYEI